MKLLTPRRHIAFEPFLTPAELAAQLRVHKSTVTRLVQRGEIEAHRIGGNLRITRRAFESYLKFGRKN